MSNNSAKLLVFAAEQLACIKITGRANFTSSLDFKTLVQELSDKGTTCFVLDLSECVLMDSTFLGVLSGFGLKMSAAREPSSGRSIELLNPNPRIAELLENLGVLHLFKVVEGTSPELAKDACEHVPVVGPERTREEITSNCLEAHKILMAIDPANVSKFKEVTQFLAEDLKKLKSTP
ncbi:MAG: anti-sigma-factor antagonist [Pedosphaera sp.]|nr:anti-sigma-factor antagonist [Pedosphaera sp.]